MLAERERDRFETKLESADEQVIENKRMYETLMIALKQKEDSKEADTEQRDYLITTNQRLGQTVEQQENRCYKLEVKIEKLKRYKNMVSSSTHMICKYCKEEVQSDSFSSHLTVCNDKNASNSALLQIQQNLPPLSIKITNCEPANHPKKGYPFSVYDIAIEYREKQWVSKKRYSLFIHLYDQLRAHFPTLTMPPVPAEFSMNEFDREQSKYNGEFLDDKSRMLSKFLQYLGTNPIARESVFFKKFLEIDSVYPDEFQILSSVQNRMSMGVANSIDFSVSNGPELRESNSSPATAAKKRMAQTYKEVESSPFSSMKPTIPKDSIKYSKYLTPSGKGDMRPTKENGTPEEEVLSD